MNKKSNVVKNEGYKRSFRTVPALPCPNTSIDKGKYCEDKNTKQKMPKKYQDCTSNEDTVNNICYAKCRPGFMPKGNNCVKILEKNRYKEAVQKWDLENRVREASRRGRETFGNVVNEWLNYDKIDKKLSDLFDDNLKQYRWGFVIALAALVIYIIMKLLQSTNEVKAPQQPTIIVQMPSGLQVPQQVLQPALQVVSPPSPSAPPASPQIINIPEAQLATTKPVMPINITDLKKTGGFNRSLFSEIESSIFSDWNTSD